MNTTKLLPHTSVLLVLLFLAVSCSDSVSDRSKLPDLPSLPSFEAINVSDEYFTLQEQSETADSSNISFLKASNMMAETLVLFRGLEVNSFTFELTELKDPEFESGTFIWQINSRDLGIPDSEPSRIIEWEITAELNTELPGTDAEWTIKTGFDPPSLSPDFNDRTLFEGMNANNGRTGEWRSDILTKPAKALAAFLFQMEEVDKEVLMQISEESDPSDIRIFRNATLNWEIVNEFQRVIRVEAKSDDVDSSTGEVVELNARWQLEQNDSELRFELLNTQKEELINITWNLETGEGIFEKDEVRECWNENLEEMEC